MTPLKLVFRVERPRQGDSPPEIVVAERFTIIDLNDDAPKAERVRHHRAILEAAGVVVARYLMIEFGVGAEALKAEIEAAIAAIKETT